MSKNLTVREIEALKPENKPYVVRVSEGLYMRVAIDGTKQWVMRFSIDGKQRDARLPEKYGSKSAPGFITLAEARHERERIVALAKRGIDFRAEEKEKRETAQRLAAKEKEERLTVRDLYSVWLQHGVNRQNENAEIKRLFGVDVLPFIGDIELAKLTDSDLLDLLKRQLRRGVIRTCVVTYQDIKQMLSWGETRQPWRRLLMDGNPATLIDIELLLPDDYEDECDRVLSAEEIYELATVFRRMEDEYRNAPDKRKARRPLSTKSQFALWICLSTLCRIGELLQAEWKHIDFAAKEWHIPAQNTKGRRGKRRPHTIFLSDFALRQFEALFKLTGSTSWCFPAKNNSKNVMENGAKRDTHVCLKSVTKQVGDRQIQFKDRKDKAKGRTYSNCLVLAGGENGAWTPHDLRRTGATMMQALGVSEEVIGRCQNHTPVKKISRVYLRYDFQSEKTEAWRKLGERLDEILEDIETP